MNPDFWKNRSVFLTGHTGFKGGWTAVLLSQMGAKVYGYSLEPPTTPNFFTVTKLETHLSQSIIANILNLKTLTQAMNLAKPSVVIHMAAQPLVRTSYNIPVETFTTNIIGTVNVLEAARQTETVKTVINVTSDKCYENREQTMPYKENDQLGGYDPYSSSKACSELVTTAYRKSFLAEMGIQLASVRAGNVIGGGDWADDRLIPDFFRSVETDKTMIIRSPDSIRPWQHVLEPISGYLILAEKLLTGKKEYADAWNFGPDDEDAKPVSWVADQLCKNIPRARWTAERLKQMHESVFLKLDNTKAKNHLNWRPHWNIKTAIQNTLSWYQSWKNGDEMMTITQKQIEQFKNNK